MDARALLNKIHKGGRRSITVSDARDILRMKYQSKRPIRSNPKHITVQLNKSSNQNFQRNNTFNRNRGFIRNNRNSFGNADNRTGLTRSTPNKNKGFIVKRSNQGILQKTISGNVPKDKHVFSNRGGITVVKRISNTRVTKTLNEDGDELEKMTLADLPDVRLPPGLLSVGKPTHFVTTSLTPQTSVMSRLNLSSDTMVADSIPDSQQLNSNRSVLVSNLLPSVSEQDIVELFGSVGNLTSVQPLRSGEMIVEFQSPVDAASAIQRFHGLALDHQIMYCSLLPRQDTPSLSSRLGETVSNFTPSGSSSSSLASYLPQFPSAARKNVKFIVQLP